MANNKSENLSKNFTRSEFVCKCGCGLFNAVPELVRMCQVIRDKICMPLNINSACRCRAHNAKVGGVPASYHTQGVAADLSINGNACLIFNVIKELYSGGKLPRLEFCKWYKNKNFVHIDIGKKRNNRFNIG